MAFTQEQIAALSAPLDRAKVKEREQGGRKVSYIEGYHAENEANRIFGFDAWDRETSFFKCVAERERKIGKGQYEKDGWGVTYIAKVRITVCAPDGTEVVREGTGAGHGIDADLGQAHESALKEAETDAEKRALKTFGNPFGQALYDKTQSDVADVAALERAEKARVEREAAEAAAAAAKAAGDPAMCEAAIAGLEQRKDGDDLAMWWKGNAPALKAALNDEQWKLVEMTKDKMKTKLTPAPKKEAA